MIICLSVCLAFKEKIERGLNVDVFLNNNINEDGIHLNTFNNSWKTKEYIFLWKTK